MHEMPGVREDGELVLSYFGGFSMETSFLDVNKRHVKTLLLLGSKRGS